MKLRLLILFFFIYPGIVQAQSDPEIYLADLTISESVFSVEYLTNISGNPGYDNQPSFTPDGKNVLFSSTRNENTDISIYSLQLNEKRWLTDVEGGEYSPTVMPDQDYFSAIRLKPDGEQLLWKFPFGGGEPGVIVPEEVIGYHTWLNESMLYAFVLGEPQTLVEFDLQSGSRKVLMSNPGRSLHTIPGQQAISFVDKNEQPWQIKSYDPESGEIKVITETLPDSEDMVWTSEGYILMGSGNTLSVWRPDSGWSKPVVVFDSSGTITRLAVSPDDSKIAIVFDKQSN